MYAVTSRNSRTGVASRVFCGSVPRLYNEELTQLESELSRELSSMNISEKRCQLADDGGIQFESIERMSALQL
jgi:hypothetical protein